MEKNVAAVWPVKNVLLHDLFYYWLTFKLTFCNECNVFLMVSQVQTWVKHFNCFVFSKTAVLRTEMYFTHYAKHFKSTYAMIGKKKYQIFYHLLLLFEPNRNLVTLFPMAYSIEQQCIIWGPRLCHLFISFCLLPACLFSKLRFFS